MKFISLNEWILNENNNNEEQPTYGCVMLFAKISDWKENHLDGIDKNDLYEEQNDDSYGLEEEPHITILYGIHENEIDPEFIQQYIEENISPLYLNIDNIDIFENEKYDVVKYNIPLTDELEKYRNLFINNFDNTQTYPDYKPHMTIAYVKPGLGKKYKKQLTHPFNVYFNKCVYSYHDINDKEKLLNKKIILDKDVKS